MSEGELAKQRLGEYFSASGKYSAWESGTLWVGETRKSLVSIPGLLCVQADEGKIRQVLKSSGRLAAVFGTDRSTGRQFDTFVVRDRNYGWDALQRQFRQQTRTALSRCGVRPVGWSELKTKAVPLHRDTFARRGMNAGVIGTESHWCRVCEVAETIPGLQAWGAFTAQEELTAYLTTWTHRGICHALNLFRSDLHQALRSTHALFFQTIRETFARGQIETFSAGRQTLPPMPSVDRFKEHAGFQREPQRVGVIVSSPLRYLIRSERFLSMLRGWRQRQLWGSRWLEYLEVLEVAACTRLSDLR